MGALTIYILVRRQMIHLTDKRKMKRSVAATLITTEAILFFLVPLALAVWLLVSKLQDINLDPQSIIAPIESAANIIKEKPVTMYWARIPLPLLSPHFLP